MTEITNAMCPPENVITDNSTPGTSSGRQSNLSTFSAIAKNELKTAQISTTRSFMIDVSIVTKSKHKACSYTVQQVQGFKTLLSCLMTYALDMTIKNILTYNTYQWNISLRDNSRMFDH
ncbi:hypothetical protein QTP88_008721 [Uroleucon formosanum]